MQDKESFLAGYLGDLGTYFWSRGQVMEKMGGTTWKGDGGIVVVEEEKEEDIDQAEEGDLELSNGGDEKKSAASKKRKSSTDEPSTSNKRTTKKTKTTTTKKIVQKPTKVLPDYVSYLVSLDLKWHAYLKDALRQASDAYLTVLDNLQKNKVRKIKRAKVAFVMVAVFFLLTVNDTVFFFCENRRR